MITLEAPPVNDKKRNTCKSNLLKQLINLKLDRVAPLIPHPQPTSSTIFILNFHTQKVTHDT